MTDTTTSAPDAAKTAAPTPEGNARPEDQTNPAPVAEEDDDEGRMWAEMEAEETGKAPPEEDRDREEFENEGSSDKQQSGASEAPDPWASAPEELRQERETLLADKQKLEHRVKTEAGRVAASQRRIAELQKMVQTPAQEGRDEDPTEKLNALAEDYPEIAGPVTEALSLISGQVSKLSANEASRREAAQRELTDLVSAEESAVAAAHPGWTEFLKQNGPAFMGWIDDQPRALREAFLRNQETITDSNAAIEVIGAFKRHINPQAEPEGQPAPQQQPPNTRRERQLAGSASPQGGNRAPVRSGIPDTADEQAIWDAMEEQEQAEQRR